MQRTMWAQVGLALLIFFLAGGRALALDTGDRAPNIGLEDLAGNDVDLQDLRGKVVLVDFWASWCEPCKEELPFLNRLYRSKRADGLVVIGVSVDRRLRNVRNFLRDTPVSFPVVHDADQDVADRYSPPTMPTSFLIDRRGVIRFIHRGFRDGDDEEITDHVNELLEEDAE